MPAKFSKSSQIEYYLQEGKATFPEDVVCFDTYDDHRMAMSFAPFALVKELDIQNEDVVEKSYPDFWTDFFETTERL